MWVGLSPEPIRNRFSKAGSISAGFSGKCFYITGVFNKRGQGLNPTEPYRNLI